MHDLARASERCPARCLVAQAGALDAVLVLLGALLARFEVAVGGTPTWVGLPLEPAWGRYFHPTAQDIGQTVDAARKANGDRPVLSLRRSLQLVAPVAGIDDLDAELAAIDPAELSVDELAELKRRTKDLAYETIRAANVVQDAKIADEHLDEATAQIERFAAETGLSVEQTANLWLRSAYADIGRNVQARLYLDLPRVRTVEDPQDALDVAEDWRAAGRPSVWPPVDETAGEEGAL